MKTVFNIVVDQSGTNNGQATEICRILDKMGYRRTNTSAFDYTYVTPEMTIDDLRFQISPAVNGRASTSLQGNTLTITPVEQAMAVLS